MTADEYLVGGSFEGGGEDNPYPGSTTVANGFYTNRAGNATFRAHLDFPIINGSYPFSDVDGSAAVSIRDNPSLVVVSHCEDHVGHGLSDRSPLNRAEGWFNWPR